MFCIYYPSLSIQTMQSFCPFKKDIINDWCIDFSMDLTNKKTILYVNSVTCSLLALSRYQNHRQKENVKEGSTLRFSIYIFLNLFNFQLKNKPILNLFSNLKLLVTPRGKTNCCYCFGVVWPKRWFRNK